jgi:hypothetical protein
MKRWFGVATLVVAGAFVSACGDGATASSSATTGSPRPTAAARASVEPAASAEASSDATALKGSGDEVVPFAIPEDAIGVAVLSHPGSGTFEVVALDEEGAATEQLVKTKGKYKGVVMFDLIEHSVAFQVTAKGKWSITVKPVESLKAWDGESTLKGKGDSVVRIATPVETDVKMALAVTGKSLLQVRSDAGDDEYLVNQKGPYKGQTTLPDGTSLIEIRTKGSWTIKPGK